MPSESNATVSDKEAMLALFAHYPERPLSSVECNDFIRASQIAGINLSHISSARAMVKINALCKEMAAEGLLVETFTASMRKTELGARSIPLKIFYQITDKGMQAAKTAQEEGVLSFQNIADAYLEKAKIIRHYFFGLHRNGAFPVENVLKELANLYEPHFKEVIKGTPVRPKTIRKGPIEVKDLLEAGILAKAEKGMLSVGPPIPEMLSYTIDPETQFISPRFPGALTPGTMVGEVSFMGKTSQGFTLDSWADFVKSGNIPGVSGQSGHAVQ